MNTTGDKNETLPNKKLKTEIPQHCGITTQIKHITTNRQRRNKVVMNAMLYAPRRLRGNRQAQPKSEWQKNYLIHATATNDIQGSHYTMRSMHRMQTNPLSNVGITLHARG